MADAPRNFDEEYAFDKQKPTAFVLGGKTLQATPILHPSIFLSRDTKLSGVEAAVKIIMGALVPKDRKVFQGLLDDPDVRISASQVDDIATWLLEVASENRPTKSRSSSGNGGAKTGTGSKGSSSTATETGGK